MHCSFCHGTKRESRQMSLGEFARIVGNLKGITEYLYLHVLGEPLTHPMLTTFIEYATKSGSKVAITTNGTLLEKLGGPLILSGVYKVNISLHSFERYGSQEAQKNYISNCIAFADEASKRGVLCVLRLWNKVAAKDSPEEKLNKYTLELLHEYFGDEWTLGARGARIRDKLHLEYGERFEWPDIILADEPTGNLDRDTQKEIMEIFRELTNQGKCVILVSHSPDVAEMCDEKYELTKISGRNKKK